MADEKPLSRAGSDNPGSKPKTLLCTEWEAMLVDALDGTLSPRDAAAFEAHRETCTTCAQLMDEATRGSQWLRFLETEPEVPSDMVARILASTSGAADAMPAMPIAAGIPVAIAQTGWLPGIERHAAQSRWVMTAAMAFFSIAFTLNLTGIRLGGLQLSDFKPNNLAVSLRRQFHEADAGVVHYYYNLRFVYELESRVRGMKRDAAPTESRSNTGQDETKPAPATDESQPAQKKPNGGSAEKNGLARPQTSVPPAADRSSDLAEPVLASFHPGRLGPCASPVRAEAQNFVAPAPIEKSTKEVCSQKDRAERSLA